MRSFHLEPRDKRGQPDPQVQHAVLAIAGICAIDAARRQHYVWAAIIAVGVVARLGGLVMRRPRGQSAILVAYVVSLAAACLFEILKLTGVAE